MVALHRGRRECAKALLRAGADPNYVNNAGDHTLFWAIDGGLETTKLCKVRLISCATMLDCQDAMFCFVATCIRQHFALLLHIQWHRFCNRTFASANCHLGMLNSCSIYVIPRDSFDPGKLHQRRSMAQTLMQFRQRAGRH